MRVLVTGAGGFLGRGPARELAGKCMGLSRLVLTDIELPERLAGAEALQGDLGDPFFVETLLDPGFDLVFHLASVPGALAERDPDLGYRANLMASLELARHTALRRPGARFVFASSIAVYGALTAETVTAETPLRPLLSYGAHKLMVEFFLSDMSRRGDLSAISLRFPGLVARPPTQSGHGSAFMSQVFYKAAAGETYSCSVPAAASCWWMSRAAVVSTLLHAAALGSTPTTVVQPPVLHNTVGDVVAAVERMTGKRASIEWGNDAELTRLFGAMPPLDASVSLGLGFRADADLDDLARAALTGDF